MLEARFRRIGLLSAVRTALEWDAAVVMPPGGAEARAEQQALLAALRHEALCEPALGDLFGAAADEPLNDMQRANLRCMVRLRRDATAEPAWLVEALARAAARCEMTWRAARLGSDFAALRPGLEEVVGLVREKAAARAAALGCVPYQALVEEHDPGVTLTEVDSVFDAVARFLPGLLGEALEAQARLAAAAVPRGPFPAGAQHRLGEAVARRLGYDFHTGRLDVSAHPFTRGTPEDVRITTRWDEADFLSGLFAVIHETGHALYVLGLPAAWRNHPVGSFAGYAVHESQSLAFEMQLGRSRGFLAWLAPLARETLDAYDPAFDPANLVRLARRVRRGLIRVDADEVSYPLHVLLRVRLERALLSGDLAVADLPGAWKDAMAELLGVVPATDAEGCLQDIHWPMGSFGYFPSYLLGAIAAAQLMGAARRALPGLGEAAARGDAAPFLGWLREHVHAHGSRYDAPELFARATGRSFDAAALEAHLRRRYLEDGE